MALNDLLVQKKSDILERWRNLVFASYTPETVRFLHSQKDRFANPIAYQLNRGLTGILDVFLEEADSEKILAHLDEVIKLKAIQEAQPSRAMAFLFLLKTIIHTELAPQLRDPAYAEELAELDSRLDGLALLGFDVFMQRRERLHEVRVGEIKRKVGALLRRLGMGDEFFEDKSGEE